MYAYNIKRQRCLSYVTVFVQICKTDCHNGEHQCRTLFILETAALTYYIGIHYCEEKYGKCNGKLQEKEGSAMTEKLLDDLHFAERLSERVQYWCLNTSIV